MFPVKDKICSTTLFGKIMQWSVALLMSDGASPSCSLWPLMCFTVLVWSASWHCWSMVSPWSKECYVVLDCSTRCHYYAAHVQRPVAIMWSVVMLWATVSDCYSCRRCSLPCSTRQLVVVRCCVVHDPRRALPFWSNQFVVNDSHLSMACYEGLFYQSSLLAVMYHVHVQWRMLLPLWCHDKLLPIVVVSCTMLQFWQLCETILMHCVCLFFVNIIYNMLQ